MTFKGYLARRVVTSCLSRPFLDGSSPRPLLFLASADDLRLGDGAFGALDGLGNDGVSSTTARGAATTATVASGSSSTSTPSGSLRSLTCMRVADRELRDVDVDVVGNVRRIDVDLELTHHLVEDAAASADALGHAGEARSGC